MKGGKHNKTAQESSSAAMRSNMNSQRSVTERLGKTTCMGNVGCAPENDATRVEHQILHVIVAWIKGKITRQPRNAAVQQWQAPGNAREVLQSIWR